MTQSPDPLPVLKKHFGHSQFRSGQKEVITSLLAERSALAVFPTGGGKSLCYQLPALLLEGVTLVISPLIALMKDQVDTLTARNIPAARLDSTLSAEEVTQIYQDLAQDKIKLLYIAPERLATEKFRTRLRSLNIALLAIDEAHCISEWGHNFRPDYLKLTRFARELKISRVLALTATATPAVAQNICQHFDIEKRDYHQLTFYRSNLNLSVTPLREKEKRTHLLKRLKQNKSQDTIIYTTLQHTAESLASFLVKNGLSARPYHAGLRNEARSEIQNEFMSGETPIICATIAFGMGIDKSNIRAIYHYNLPKSLENYTQEIGRAGRDGEPAHCELLACQDDLRTLENFTYGDTPQPHTLQKILYSLLEHEGEFDISNYELSRTNDIRPLVLNTLLTYLELEGYLVATTPFYSTYKIRFTRSQEHLLQGFDQKRRDFLSQVFTHAKAGKWWFELNPDNIALKIDQPREKIIKAIQYLEELGDIAVKPSGLRQGYRILKKPDDHAALTQTLIQLFQRREESDLTRLQQVLDYALAPHCFYQSLLTHFGETIAPCDHCSRCQDDTPPTELPSSPKPEIKAEDLSLIQELIREKHPGLRSQRSLTRFLCGLTSPATSYAWYLPAGEKKKRRLMSHDAYSLLEMHSFSDVLEFCETQIID